MVGLKLKEREDRIMADFAAMANGGIAQLLPYRMGKPLELMQAKLRTPHLIRLNAGESPFGVSRKVREVMQSYERNLNLYPDSGCYFLKQELKRLYGYELNNITVGADNEELITLLCRAFLNPQVNVIIPQLSSVTLDRAATIAGAAIIPTAILDDWTPDFDAILDAINERTRMIMLANPSNPIGAFALKSHVADFLSQVPEEIIVVIDEGLIDYLGGTYEDFYSLLSLYPNLVLLRSFSHAYGLASLRIGFMLSHEEICGICNVLRDPHNVSGLAQECALAALQDKTFITYVVRQTNAQRSRYRDFCARYGFAMIETRTCSVTIDFGANAERYYQELMRHGVFTRPLSYLGLNSLINITLSHADETTLVLKILENLALSDAYVLSRIASATAARRTAQAFED